VCLLVYTYRSPRIVDLHGGRDQQVLTSLFRNILNSPANLPFLGFSSEENTSYEYDRPGFDDVLQFYIDPVECIDCGACVPVCPVSAIFALDDLPEKWKQYAKLNASYVHAARFTPEECAKHSTK
jgi:NAD-dependent dihydropyrimidine dehydrogenase PreA subunit